MSAFDNLGLSPEEQLLFIKVVVNRYEDHEGSNKQSPETKSLLIFIKSGSNSDEAKVAYVKQYLNNRANHHRTFYQNFIEEIRRFNNPEYQADFTINGFSRNDLANLTEESKREILESLLRSCIRKDISFFKNFPAIRLIREIKSEGFTTEEKWNNVLRFFSNEQTKESGVYWTIADIITPQVFLKSAEARASTQDSENCRKALSMLNRIVDKDRLEHAKPDEELPRSAAIARVRDIANRGLVNTGAYNNHYPERARGSAVAHSWSYFKRSVKTGAKSGAKVPAVIAEKAAYFDPVGYPIALAALAVAAVTGAVGTLIGGVHGFFKVDTRYPIDSPEQSTLINNLRTISANPDLQARVVEEIYHQYKATKSSVASSKGSTDLYNILDSRDLQPNQKWDAVVAYVARIEDGLLVNNGKKLFCIIDEVVKNPLYQNGISSHSPVYVR